MGRLQMIRPIVKDIFFLGQKAEPATKEDTPVIQDLLETLQANTESCVGMAANMIGVKKRIIAVNMGFALVPMINPIIVEKSGPFDFICSYAELRGRGDAKSIQKIQNEPRHMRFG